MSDDFYAVLGVPRTATAAEIKTRFRFLCHAYHPDKFATDAHRQIAEAEFKRINVAYEVLSDPIQRESYDETCSRSTATPQAEPHTRPEPPPTAKPDFRAYPDKKPPEEILADVGANLFRGMEAVGGRMKITTHRIMFKPHAINFQRTPEEIPLSDISEVGRRNTMGLIPNGLLIRTNAGGEYKFVVSDRDKLIGIIQRQRRE